MWLLAQGPAQWGCGWMLIRQVLWTKRAPTKGLHWSQKRDRCPAAFTVPAAHLHEAGPWLEADAQPTLVCCPASFLGRPSSLISIHPHPPDPSTLHSLLDLHLELWNRAPQRWYLLLHSLDEGPGPRLTAPVLISSGPFYFTSLSSIHPSIYPSAQSFHCICWALLWPGQRASGRQKQKSIPGKSLEPQARPPGFKSSPTTSCVIGSAPLLGPQPLSSNTRERQSLLHGATVRLKAVVLIRAEEREHT